jgi:transglutaminase-like putative cysteine protease
MRRVSVEILDGVPNGAGGDPWLLLPRPIEAGNQDCSAAAVDGVRAWREVAATGSRQRAYLVLADGDAAPVIRYDVHPQGGRLPDWVWEQPDNRYTRAAPELAAMARGIADCCEDAEACVLGLVRHAAGRFAYDHPEQRFNDGKDSVPLVCGTARGSCVDINGYLLAAAHSLGLRVQYLAGYWFHPERVETSDMHCWLAFGIDERVIYWDLAHHLKWGVAELTPGLNPAGGRRVLMSYGRGLRFPTPHGEVEISHFSEPVWILPGGATRRPKLRIRLEESDAVYQEQTDGID